MESRTWHKCYEPQVPSSLNYLDITLPAMVEHSAERFRDRPAVAFWNNCLNYSQLKDQIDRLATGMAKLGVTKGERIAISLDQVLVGHIAVLESASIGMPDAKQGEIVKSFVVLREGQSTTEAELIEHCRQQLASYKVPRHIEFRDSLPKSTVLKVLRRELRKGV